MLFTINLHCVTSNQIATCRKPNLPLTSCICLVSLDLEKQGIFKQTKVYHTFYFVSKETTLRPLKVAATCMYVCMLLVQLSLMINLKTILFITGYPYFEIVLTAMLLLSLKPMF